MTEVLRLVDAREVDVVFCWRWDRFIREPLDLEHLIPRFDKAGVRFAEADGVIDLGTDSGRLAARILVAVAKAEQERKSERQKLANEAAAIAGKRPARRAAPVRLRRRPRHPAPGGGPGGRGRAARRCSAAGRSAGSRASGPRPGCGPSSRVRPVDHPVRPGDPAEPADRRAVGLPRARSSGPGPGSRWSVRRPGGRCGRILQDPARTVPRGVRTLLGGLALCPCGTVVSGMTSATGRRIYRCEPADRNRAWTGGHVARQAVPVEDFITRLVTGAAVPARRRRAAGGPEGGPDVAALREEAAAIRRNLEELAADRASG